MRAGVRGPILMLLVLLVLATFAGLGWWAVHERGPTPGAPSAPSAESAPAPDAAPTPDGAETSIGSERQPATTPTESQQLILRVFRPNRTPVVEARVAVFRGQAVLGTGRTAKDGTFVIDGSPGAASVVAAPSDTMPYRVEIARAVGQHDLVLPTGAQVAGVVRVDGAPPPLPFQLELWGEDDVSRDPELPGAVRAFLGQDRSHWLQLRAESDAAGQFRFHHLPPDWSGNLSWPRHCATDEDPTGWDRTIDVPRPTTGIVLDLRQMPRWSGRVETAEGDSCPDARVEIAYRCEDDQRGHRTRGGTTDPDGRFHIRLPLGAISEAVVTATGGDGLSRASRTIEQPPPGDLDLGAFVLVSPREVRFLAQTADGTAIEGAVATAATDPDAHSEPTGEDGRGVIRVAADEAEIDVGAMGFAVQRVPIPLTPPDPLRVVLTRGTWLTVRAVTPDDRPLDRIWIRLESDQRLFATDDGGLHAAHLHAGARRLDTGYYGTEGVRMDYTGTPETAVSLAGILPGVEFTLRAWHPGSSFLAEQALHLGSGEWREVKLVVAEEPRELHGQVIDPQGEPIHRAALTLSADGETRGGGFTDENGAFHFGLVYAPEVQLVIEKHGFIPFGGRVPAGRVGSEPTRVVLLPGRTVLVEVVDPSGEPFAEIDLHVVLPNVNGWDGKAFRGYCDLDRGRAKVEYLPPEIVTFEIALAGKQYTRSHDASQPTARFVLPAHGRVVVRWTERTAIDRGRQLILHPADTQGAEVMAWLPGSETGRVVFDAVLPGTYEVRISTEETTTAPAEILAVQAGLTVDADRTASVTFLHALAPRRVGGGK